MAKNLVAAQFVQPPPEAFQESDFVLAEAVDASGLHVLNARRQPGHAEHVGRAAFEKMRKLRRLRLAGGIATRAALPPGSQRDARADVQGAGAGRSEKRLVAGKG